MNNYCIWLSSTAQITNNNETNEHNNNNVHHKTDTCSQLWIFKFSKIHYISPSIYDIHQHLLNFFYESRSGLLCLIGRISSFSVNAVWETISTSFSESHSLIAVLSAKYRTVINHSIVSFLYLSLSWSACTVQVNPRRGMYTGETPGVWKQKPLSTISPFKLFLKSQPI